MAFDTRPNIISFRRHGLPHEQIILHARASIRRHKDLIEAWIFVYFNSYAYSTGLRVTYSGHRVYKTGGDGGGRAVVRHDSTGDVDEAGSQVQSDAVGRRVPSRDAWRRPRHRRRLQKPARHGGPHTTAADLPRRPAERRARQSR